MSLLTEKGLAPTLCPQRLSCLGGGDSACAEGHEGPLCGTCSEGYYRRDTGCQECDSTGVPSVALYASGGSLILILAFLYMYVQLRRSVLKRAAEETTAVSVAEGAVDSRRKQRRLARWRRTLVTLAMQLFRRARSPP